MIFSANSRWGWHASRLLRKVWFRAGLFSLAAVVTALASTFASPYIPAEFSTRIGSGAVDSILQIIASSMLAVTTFSLNVMVSAYSAATNNVTPRATSLVIEDRTTQNVLATFLGSFLFSLVALISLSTGAYGPDDRVVLFAVTIALIGLIVLTLLRWIDHLSTLGRVIDTTARVEDTLMAAIEARRKRPWLGGQPLDPALDQAARSCILADKVGYLQHLDVAALNQIAAKSKQDIHVAVLPGKFVDPQTPLAWIGGPGDLHDDIRDCFTVGEVRSFDQDPRFAACVLSEIALRALSPGINDPGTAIDVIGRAVRVAAAWARKDDESKPEYEHVFVPPISPDDLLDDLFGGIARDGAGFVEIGIRLQKAFRTLQNAGDAAIAAAARRHSRVALQYSESTLRLEDEKQRVRDAAL